jgi:hypothetical protein
MTRWVQSEEALATAQAEMRERQMRELEKLLPKSHRAKTRFNKLVSNEARLVRLTDEQRAEIKARYHAGETARAVALAFGCSTKYVMRVSGRRPRLVTTPQFNLTEEQRLEILSRYQRGDNAVQLCKEFNISYRALRHIGGFRELPPHPRTVHTPQPRRPRPASDSSLPKDAVEARKLRLERELQSTEKDQGPIIHIDLVRQALREAQPDGSICIVKACPFPALVAGRCRQHYIDLHAAYSLNPCTHDLVVNAL